VVTALAMPLTFSFANGIAFGFITYVATKLLAGKFRQAGLTMIVLALLFALRYALLAGS
jgi:AGZA family xanthine/uracil permease-like MFS transporter